MGYVKNVSLLILLLDNYSTEQFELLGKLLRKYSKFSFFSNNKYIIKSFKNKYKITYIQKPNIGAFNILLNLDRPVKLSVKPGQFVVNINKKGVFS